MTTVPEIAAEAGVDLPEAPAPRQIELLDLHAGGEVGVELADGTRLTVLADGVVPPGRKSRPEVLISGAELVRFLQSQGALSIPARPGRYVRRKVIGGDGKPTIVFGEVGR